MERALSRYRAQKRQIRWFSGRALLRSLPAVVLLFNLYAVSAAPLLSDDLLQALEQHERILAAEKDIGVAVEARRTAFAGYLPSVNATILEGRENIKNADGSRTKMGFNEQGINLTQSLYDFGLTEAQVDVAGLGIERAEAALRLVQENLTMEGVSAYLGLEKTVGRVDYALQSENNIMKQTGMEESLVEAGAGIPSDVLQTKAQLTGTQALRVQEEGMKQLAESRYWAVFGVDPQHKAPFTVPEPAVGKLPINLDQALQQADQYNAEIEIGQFDIKIAKATVRNHKANAQPKLSFNLDYKQKHNGGGSSGDKTEGVAKVQLSWPLYNGGREQSAIDSGVHAQKAAILRLEDTRKRVHEAVRTAWYNWKTAEKTSGLLRNQSNIALEFLELARIERKLGSRTLQDVLTGETAYLTAVSNAVSADIEYKVAAYQLLNAIGLIGIEEEAVVHEATHKQAGFPLNAEELSLVVKPTEAKTIDAVDRAVERIADEVMDSPPDWVKYADEGIEAMAKPEQNVLPVRQEAEQLTEREPHTVNLIQSREKDEADSQIFSSRSKYQEHNSRIEVGVARGLQPQPSSATTSVELRGGGRKGESELGPQSRRMIEIGNVDMAPKSRGIRLVGPGGMKSPVVADVDLEKGRKLIPLR